MTAIDDIAQERQRQITEEGFGPQHDDQYNTNGQLADAAACYAVTPARQAWVNILWPWGHSWWKPRDRRRDLVRAGALIVAEIERIDRSFS